MSDVLPFFTVDDGRYVGGGDPVPCGQVADSRRASRMIGAHPNNIRSRQSGRIVLFTVSIRAVHDTIVRVALSRTPTQIVDTVVARITIVVAALHAGWTRPDEQLQD